MRYCDLTLAYTDTSGGIRTYIDQKRQFLRQRPDDVHILIVPGQADRWIEEPGCITCFLESPIIPGCAPYRMFVDRSAVLEALIRADPDVVELGSYFVSPKPAFEYRKEKQQRDEPCLVAGYFHTDLALSYFGAPVREAFLSRVGQWSETIAAFGARMGDLLEWGATNYFGNLFRQCDLMCAPTAVQADRLEEYGVARPEIVPLGTDLHAFHPDHRSETRRAELGIGEEDRLLVYVGRQDIEKHCQVLVDAVRSLDDPKLHLLMVGDGPMRAALLEQAETHPWLKIHPFESDKQVLAEILASADVYITAGPHETFGLAVVEAQASGLPVVGVNAGALRERVPPEVGLLGPPGDAEAMAANIRQVLADRERYARNARHHVESEGYGWDRTFEKLFAAYDRAWPAEVGE